MKECYKVKDLFGPYIYDSVTPEERVAVEEHIRTCEECAADLKSRKEVLDKLKPSLNMGEMPQRTRDNFTCNVYKRIALDALKSRTRQVFFQRFVLQPSIAVVAMAIIAIFGLTQFNMSFLNNNSYIADESEEADQKELRASLYMDEFFQNQGISHKQEPVYAGMSKADPTFPVEINENTQNLMMPVSQKRLEDANFINYSLGDRRQSLAEYQERIRSILDTNGQLQNKVISAENPDMGI
jgi:hypothetical protein